MFCRHCGAQVNDNDTVCGRCGALTELGEKVSRHDAVPPARNGSAVNPDGTLNREAYRQNASPENNNGNYYYAPQNAGYPRATERRSNGMALAGFVCAFIAPLIGLILSIIGYRKAGELGGEGKGMAKAGIILSIVFMALTIVATVAYINFLFDYIDGGPYYGFLRAFIG